MPLRHRIRFYSDDSYAACGKKRSHVVVAGVAINADRTNITDALVRAERSSKKGLTDWHKTHSASARQNYLDAVLNIEALRDRFFFCPYDSLAAGGYWDARLQTLAAAINVFTPGDCHHVMFHEGLQGRPRFNLRKGLRDCGCEAVSVETAQFVMDPEVRLSDAIAGYVRGELYRGDGQRAVLTNIPDGFVNLEPQIRNPPELPGGLKARTAKNTVP